MMPTTRKRWRKAEDGSGELEECTSLLHVPCSRPALRLLATITNSVLDWDLAFPDDEREANPASYNFFRAAQDWAAKKAAGGGLSYDMASDSESEDEDEDAEMEADAVDGVDVDAAVEAMEQDE